MDNLRKTPRVETQHIVSAKYDDNKGKPHDIRAMLLNISLDGAMIETAEALTGQTLILCNQYKKQDLCIQANVVYQQDVLQDERVFGPFRTGLLFSDASRTAKDFIISIIKYQDDEENKRAKSPSPFMDTAQISHTLFSSDSAEEEKELSDALDSVANVLEAPTLKIQMKPSVPRPANKQNARILSESTPKNPSGPTFKETVEKTLSETPKKNLRTPPPLWPMALTLLAFFLLIASLFVFRTPAPKDGRTLTLFEKIGIDLPFIGERPVLPPRLVDGTALDKTAQLPARLLKETIEGSVIHNETLGLLFVIRGVIQLEQGHRLEEIIIRGKLLSDKNDLMASLSTWPGNALDDVRIASLDESGLITARQYTPDKGYRAETPFIIIFSEIPANTRSFTVDLTFKSFLGTTK